MKHLAFVLVASFLTSSVAFSQVAEQLLARDILATKKSMPAATKIYSYFSIQPNSYFDSLTNRREFVQRVLKNGATSFWNMGFNNNDRTAYACGPGMYFAIDPHISKKYGNSFVEMTIPQGTNYINVVNAITINKDTMAALVSENFITEADKAILFPPDKPTGKRGFYRDTLRAMVVPQYAKFRKMVQNIFATNEIQFVEYNFNTSLSGFCKSAKTSAFLYVGLQDTRNAESARVSEVFSDVNMYSTEIEIKNQSSEEESRQSEIVKFRSLLDEMSNLRAQKIAIPKTLIPSRLSSDEIKTIKSQTYSCQ
jgi:hypothetical protein